MLPIINKNDMIQISSKLFKIYFHINLVFKMLTLIINRLHYFYTFCHYYITIIKISLLH